MKAGSFTKVRRLKTDTLTAKSAAKDHARRSESRRSCKTAGIYLQAK